MKKWSNGAKKRLVEIRAAEDGGIENDVVGLAKFCIFIQILADDHAALADAVYADFFRARKLKDIVDIVLQHVGSLIVVDTPVIGEIKDVFIAYSLANRLHIKEFGACVRDAVEHIISLECGKRGILRAADYGLYIVI